MRRRACCAVATVVFLVLAALTASGGLLLLSGVGLGSQPLGGTASISIMAVPNYGFQPETIGNLPLNTTITVTFTDADVLPHTFNISKREGFQIPNNYTASQMNQLFDEYHDLYAAQVNYSGASSVGSFISPSAPGWYEFICNVSGHFAEGMYGFIAFGEPVPSNLTLPHHGSEVPTTGSPVVAILGGAVIAAVLAGVAVWQLRRLRRRLPPEQRP